MKKHQIHYIWTKRDTHVEGVAQLKLLTLDNVNMA